MVQLLAGIISLRRVLEANPGRSHGSADTLPLRHSANYLLCRHIQKSDNSKLVKKQMNWTHFLSFNSAVLYVICDH